jgi:hypothetical protein
MIAEAQFGGGGAENIRSVLAHLTRAPPNLHQCVVFFAASDAPDDAGMRARAPLLYLGSLVMVLTQCMATIAVWVGTFFPSCASSAHCGMGTWCRQERCAYCGDTVPLLLEVGADCEFGLNRYGGQSTKADAACSTRNWARDPNFVGFNQSAVAGLCAAPSGSDGLGGRGDAEFFPRADVASWCETCVHPIDGVVESMTNSDLIVLNLSAMSILDIFALIFTAFIIACTVVGELKDVELCHIAAQHHAKLSSNWRLAFSLINLLRRWLFLPFLMMVVPVLLMYLGGDALSVCFNTIAVLFRKTKLLSQSVPRISLLIENRLPLQSAISTTSPTSTA